MSFSPTSRQIVLQEVFDEGSVPTEEEIHDYALKIGINVENESHLLYLARDGLMEALPPGWKPCYDEDREEIYYFNFNTRKAQWEHPLDEVYRNLVKKARNESVVAADQLDDDSRTSIKEDLKSFEEASLILPSSEMYPKSKVLEPLSPLGLGGFRRSPTALGPMKKSTSKELMKGSALKLPLEIDEDLLLNKAPESELNQSKKSFDESQVKKRPNSSDIRNRRNIGPMEFRHLSKQEIITPKNLGKNLFFSESKRAGDISKLNGDIQSSEARNSENVTIVKDEGYGTEFSASSLGEREVEAKGDGFKRELTVSGGGSIFLKTNKNKFSPCSDIASLTFSKEESSEGLGSLSTGGKKSNSETDFHSKGILREHKSMKSIDKELGAVNDGLSGIPRKNCEDDRKSVRFNLEKDLKVNFEMPERSYGEHKDNFSAESKSSKIKRNLSKSWLRNDDDGIRRQIELDFEELEMNLGESSRVELGTGSKAFEPDERQEDERRPPATPEPVTTVKPKKFKSSQSLVQEFREIFEAKSKTKINIPISSPFKIEETVTRYSSKDQEKVHEEEEADENSSSRNRLKDVENTGHVHDGKVVGGKVETSKTNVNNLIDLTDCDETKDSSSINESQRESTKTDRSLLLKEEIIDSDLADLVDYALKNKLFDKGAAATQSESSDGYNNPGSESKDSVKEKIFLLDEVLKIGKSEILSERSEDKILGTEVASPKSKPEVVTPEKPSEDCSGRYEKKKSDVLKRLEADFNEWLSETEKAFEERKSNALVKMKEKFEEWKANRESEFAKMYREKREEETQNKYKELRNEFVKKEQEEIERLRDQLEREKKEKLSHLRMEMENETEKERQRMREILEERLNEEKSNIMQKHKEELENAEQTLQVMLSEKQAQKTKEAELAREAEKALEELRVQLKVNYEEEKTNLTKEHETMIDDLRQLHAAALESLRVDLKKEEEALKKFHADRLDEMILKLGAIETKKLEIVDNQKTDVTERRMYAKVLFEKWFLEDEYETLKEKYMRLKSEAKQSLERKKKSASTTGSETERSSSKKSSSIFRKSDCECLNSKRSHENEKKTKLKKPFSNLDNFNAQNVSTEEDENVASVLSASEQQQQQPQLLRKSKKSPEASNKNRKSEERRVIVCDSANEPTPDVTSAESLKKTHSNDTKKRRQLFSRLKALSTSRINSQNRTQNKEMRLSPVENLRRQLKKLEELEDQFPVTTHTDTYMRYPFTDIPQVGSSEIEFFKHRIHLERESVRRAKESLKMQKKSFESRQRELKQRLLEGGPEAKAVMEQIYQEERELTDMEVSVHRTRALLGEKIIRLRHLEQSLKRISEPRKKDSFMSKDVLGRFGFRSQSKEDDRTLSDLSSHSGGSSGFSSTDVNVTDTQNGNRAWNKTNAEENRRQFQNNMQESSEIIQSLENLNSEIREIWEVLKKQHQTGQGGALLLPPPPLIYAGDSAWPAFTLTPPMAFRNTIITSNSNVERSVAQQLKNQVTGSPNSGHVTTVVQSSLVDRTKSLRDWLKAARNSSTPSEVVSPNQVTL